MNLFSGLGSDDEVRLVNVLFETSGYNPLIRPVKNVNDNLTVQFNLALSQLINIVSSLFTDCSLQVLCIWYQNKLISNTAIFPDIFNILLKV